MILKVEENIETNEADKSLPIPTHRNKVEGIFFSKFLIKSFSNSV